MESQKDKVNTENTIDEIESKPKKKNIFERLKPEKLRALDEETKKKNEKKSWVIAWLLFIVILAICAIIFSKYSLIAFDYVKKEILSYETASILELIVKIPKHLLCISGIVWVCYLIVAFISGNIDKLLEYKYTYGSAKKIFLVCLLDTLEFLLVLGIVVLVIWGVIKFIGWFVTTKAFTILIKIILGIIVVVGIYLLLFKYEVVHYKPGVHSFTYLDEDFRCPVWVEVLLYIIIFIIIIVAIYKFTTT